MALVLITSLSDGSQLKGLIAALLGLEGPVVCADGSHIVEVPSGATLVHHGIAGEHAALLREGIAQGDMRGRDTRLCFHQLAIGDEEVDELLADFPGFHPGRISKAISRSWV